MLLTESWVNAVSIAIVAASLVRLWHGARRQRAGARGTAPKQPVSAVDAYLLFQHTRGNRAEIERSEMCGCLWCEQLYRPNEIAGWSEETAVCPRCGRMMVVGSGSGIMLTRELLRRTHAVGVREETRAG